MDKLKVPGKSTTLKLNLIIDKGSSTNDGKSKWYFYKSKEKMGNTGKTPVINGMYIRRKSLGDDRPENISLTLEWS